MASKTFVLGLNDLMVADGDSFIRCCNCVIENCPMRGKKF